MDKFSSEKHRSADNNQIKSDDNHDDEERENVLILS